MNISATGQKSRREFLNSRPLFGSTSIVQGGTEAASDIVRANP